MELTFTISLLGSDLIEVIEWSVIILVIVLAYSLVKLPLKLYKE